ncbi:MAG: hypothetical protein R3E02_10020 [Blastomonas sp.]
MIDNGHHLTGFYATWATSLATLSVAGDAPAHLGEIVMLDLGGVAFPLITGLVAAAGVLMARPLTPRQTPPLGFGKQLLVTLIMLAIALIWVGEARPRLLFTFLVSLGLGFSGYALIELAGEEIRAFIKRIFAAATATIDRISGKKDDS